MTIAHRLGCAALSVAAACSASQVRAQEDAASSNDTQKQIVVTGIRGSAIEETAPIAVLGADAIAALGAQSIDEVNRALQGQTRSASGADPILLLNAQRVSGYQEIQSLPPEAIEKIEILPEVAALRFGFPPTRRVVNYITKLRFKQYEALLAAGSTVPFGRATENARVGYTRLLASTRLTANLDVTRSDALFWSERAVVPDPDVPFDAIGNVTGLGGGEIDPALSALAGRPVVIAAVPIDPALRRSIAAYAAAGNVSRAFQLGNTATLAPANDRVKAEAVFGAPIGSTMSGSLTLTAEHSRDRALGGPASAALIVPASNPYSPFGAPVVLNRYLTEADPLRNQDRKTTLSAGATVRGAVAGWQWDATLALSQTVQRGITDRSIDLSAANAAIVAGANPSLPLEPALLTDRLTDRTRQRTRTGEAKVVASNDPIGLPAGRATVTLTLEAGRLSATSSTRGPVDDDLRLSRTRTEAGASVNLPLTSRAEAFLPIIGDISANASANGRRIGGFGTLSDTTFGLSWTPLKGLQLLANARASQAAPDPAALLTPLRTQENVPLFDFASGRTELVTVFQGGNEDLRAERRRVRTFSVTYKPFDKSLLQLGASYDVTEIRDGAGVVVALNARNQGLVPDLFTRDVAGKLTSVTFRPINFDFQRQRKLQFSLSSTGRIGAPPTIAAEGAPPALDARPSYYVGLVPIFALEDRLRLRPGTAPLDLIGGDSIGGYAPRYSGYSYGGVNAGGYGATYGVYYGGERPIRGDTPATDLRFLSILQIACSAYMPVADLVPGKSWARGLTLRLELTNILNAQQRVRDGNGRTPIRYQADLIDPVARTATLSLRKRF